MQRFKGLLILAAGILIGVALGAVVLFSSPNLRSAHRITPPSTGRRVPDFNLQQLSGAWLDSKALRGKPVVINFWATWCPPCREEMPLLDQYAVKLAGRATIIGINDDEDAKIVSQYIQQARLNLSILLDPGGKINRLYFIQSYPNTFFIDSEGILKAQHIGQMDETTFLRGLEALGIKP